MEAHTDANLGVIGPFVLGERALGVGSRSDGFPGGSERDEERVAFRIDLMTPVLRECVAQQTPVLG
jgi:hypothetical protein